MPSPTTTFDQQVVSWLYPQRTGPDNVTYVTHTDGDYVWFPFVPPGFSRTDQSSRLAQWLMRSDLRLRIPFEGEMNGPVFATNAGQSLWDGTWEVEVLCTVSDPTAKQWQWGPTKMPYYGKFAFVYNDVFLSEPIYLNGDWTHAVVKRQYAQGVQWSLKPGVSAQFFLYRYPPIPRLWYSTEGSIFAPVVLPSGVQQWRF